MGHPRCWGCGAGETRQRRGHRRSLGPCRGAIGRRVLHESCLLVQLDAVKDTKRVSGMNLAGGVESGQGNVTDCVWLVSATRHVSFWVVIHVVMLEWQRAGGKKEAKGVLFVFPHLELNHDSGS